MSSGRSRALREAARVFTSSSASSSSPSSYSSSSSSSSSQLLGKFKSSIRYSQLNDNQNAFAVTATSPWAFECIIMCLTFYVQVWQNFWSKAQVFGHKEFNYINAKIWIHQTRNYQTLAQSFGLGLSRRIGHAILCCEWSDCANLWYWYANFIANKTLAWIPIDSRKWLEWRIDYQEI